VDTVAAHQHGVVSRGQALASGMTKDEVRHRVRRGVWQVIHPGIYLTSSGETSFLSRAWAAWLHAGPRSALSHRTAARLQSLLDEDPPRIDVTIPEDWRVTVRAGIVVHHSRFLDQRLHPARAPGQTRIEETVLDLVDTAGHPDEVITWVLRACQRRLTTPARIAFAAAARSRLRHRALLAELLADTREGVASPLERRYRRDVERAHGLPKGVRGGAWIGPDGRRRYFDVRYVAWRVRVELEGLAFHPAERSAVDHARDNAAVLQGDVVLRYGWHPVTATPCDVAAQVGAVLTLRGWASALRACGPTCQAPVSSQLAGKRHR
jgi:hypothetical protein